MQSDRLTITTGSAGFLATLTLGEINALVGVLVGLTTLGFMTTRWFVFIQRNGGWRAFLRSPAPPPSPPAVRPCPDCPADKDPPAR